MFARRLKELLGLAMIGEGVLAALYPQRYMTLWHTGPKAIRDLTGALAHRPMLTRSIAVAEIGAGLWLASRQLPS